MSRMKILNAVEQEQFESPPVFNSVQRKQYFDFSSELLTLAQDLQTSTNQVCFLVSCGYFKAAKRFFPNRRCSRRDLDYVSQQLGFQPESIDVNSYSATTRLRHERLILDFYGFRPFDSTAKSLLARSRSWHAPSCSRHLSSGGSSIVLSRRRSKSRGTTPWPSLSSPPSIHGRRSFAPSSSER
jgi:uncharacterized protein DUF4158